MARGFTLIELLVVIGILAVLLAITLVAIKPPARQATARLVRVVAHDFTASSSVMPSLIFARMSIYSSPRTMNMHF